MKIKKDWTDFLNDRVFDPFVGGARRRQREQEREQNHKQFMDEFRKKALAQAKPEPTIEERLRRINDGVDRINGDVTFVKFVILCLVISVLVGALVKWFG